jgi:hypothetical protein
VINQKDVVGGTCGMHGERGKICRVCFKNLKKKEELERPRYRWEIYTKIGLQIFRNGVD